MAVTVTTVFSSPSIYVADIKASADADTTATLTHLLGATPQDVTLTSLNQSTAALSQWAATTINGTNVVLTKATAAGSGGAANQVRCVVKLALTPPDWVNVADYAGDIGAAISACPTGGTVYVPAGIYAVPASPGTTGWTIDKAMTLMGEKVSPNQLNSGVILQPYYDGTTSRDSTVLNITATENVYIKDIAINANNYPSADGTGDGIRIDASATVSSFRFERISIGGMGRDGFHLASTASVDSVVLRDCSTFQCRGNGFYLQHCATPLMEGCLSTSCGKCGVSLDQSGAARLYGVAMQGNATSTPGTDPDVYPQLHLINSDGTALVGCYFEDFNGAGTSNARTAITINNSFGGFIGGCIFSNNTVNVAGSRSIYLIFTTRGWTIASNSHREVDIAVEIAGTGGANPSLGHNVGNVILTQAIQENSANTTGRIVVPTDSGGTDPESGYNFYYGRLAAPGGTYGAGNDLVGLVFPRVSGISTIDSTQIDPGLVVYDKVVKKLGTWDGVGWRDVTAAGNTDMTTVGGSFTNDKTLGKVSLNNAAPNDGGTGNGHFPATQLIRNVPGAYLVTFYAVVRTALTGGTMSFTLRWTDGQGARSFTPASSLATAAGSTLIFDQVIDSASGNVTIEANAGRAGAIDLRVRAISLP